MKKTMTLCMIFFCAAVLSACTGNADNTNIVNSSETAVETASEEKPKDHFNDIEKIIIVYSELPIRITTESFFGLNGSLITINREVELLSEDWDGSETISESVFACSTVSTII